MSNFNQTIEKAKKILMESWPLGSFIATNPLWGLREKPFFEVVSSPLFKGLMDLNFYHLQYRQGNITASDLHQSLLQIDEKDVSHHELTAWINQSFLRQHKKILTTTPLFAEQCDEYQFQQPLTWIQEKIYCLLRDYFGMKHYLETDLLSYWQQKNQFTHIDVDELQQIKLNDTIESLLNQLNIPQQVILDYLQSIYLHVYGWASLLNWRNHHPDNPWLSGQDDCEIIILIWLYYETLIAQEKAVDYCCDKSMTQSKEQKLLLKHIYIWHTACELHYFNKLTASLPASFSEEHHRYDAQFIFCIDTRSEGLRRHIEAQGNYQTFGVAGFFGIIFKLIEDNNIAYQAPALLEPSLTLTKKNYRHGVKLILKQCHDMLSLAKKQLIAPFFLFEMVGFWFLFFMLFKTVQPRVQPKAVTSDHEIDHTLSEQQQFQAAYNLLISIGLVNHFSDWVFICAHQSNNINNPFSASLNCGACGGNSGIPNAQVMSGILNDVKIRFRLKEAGIIIPTETTFIPACHHTSYDRFEVIAGCIPEKIEKAINLAADHLLQEKQERLLGRSQQLFREKNWSELIPELGLMNNAAMIIAPRTLTLQQNLQQQVFLHSYSPQHDDEGKILTQILSGPAIVAHWINAQYYFSTVNPEVFGAGNKAIHNVLPDVGVLEGNLSDLKVGLPLQSTYFQSAASHQPRRLTVIIYAKKQLLQQAIAHSPAFKTLLNNDWIYMKHIEAT